MAREKDPAEVIQVIAESIRVSQRKVRKVKAHRFKELFGYQVLNAQRRERIEQLMAEWLAHMASVPTDTEREVEMRFASPLFREGFGYTEDQEAAGFSIESARGSKPGHIEADLLYFADDKHHPREGQPLVLVECKRLIKDEKGLQAAVTQVRSYALWVVPAYYVITDGRIVSVWDFQGAIAPDREVMTVSQAELAESFDDLYSHLNPRAAAAARHATPRQDQPAGGTPVRIAGSEACLPR